MDVVKIDSAFYTRDSAPAQGLLFLADKKIILDGRVPLFQFIDNAGFDGKSIYKIRAAREVSFNCRAFLKDKSTGNVLLRPELFSELVRYLDEDKLAQYRFVLETDDKELLSEIIQQLLYLDIDMEVMLQNEEAAIRRMDLFLENFEDLQRFVEEARSSIYLARVDDSMKDYKNTILYTLSDIGGTIREMQVKELKVAIMALKKSGKSVVVNCLLGDDYTPTSIELPTFTTCIYKKSKNGKISLFYKNNTTSFDSPASLKQYVLKEFRDMHSASALDHSSDPMNISYVPRQNGTFPYTIIDTPGPDLAGSRHRDIAYKWIQEADVILFIIDYSKYLTDSEEEFLRDIKVVFEEHRKFYSFIVVVNKLDLMYLSEEKKSGLRFIDFLRSKLKELGYKGIVIFGLSALQYLYALKATQIQGCANLNTADGKDLRERLDQCLLMHQGKDDMTVLSFLDNQIRNLRWFHGKEDANLQDLKDKSGFENLMRYINYISMEKAQIELLNHKMSLVNKKLDDYQNSFIDNLLKRLEQDYIKLEEIIHDITNFIETSMPIAGQRVTMEMLLVNIKKDLSLAQKSLNKVLTMQLDSCVKQLSKIFKSLTGKELLSFQRDGRIAATEGIVYSIGKPVIEKLYAPVLGKYKGNLGRELSEERNTLEQYQRAMDEKITMLNTYLAKNYRLRNEDISLP
ncbi:MAG: dynamin family protein, partial [Dissulfurispiraceae bacterium]